MLDPLRAHYLKKALVALELRDELAALCAPPALAHLGPPFRQASPPAHRDLPLLVFLFRHFVLPFPFLAAAPDRFYPDKLQPFIDSLLARRLLAPDADDRTPARLDRTLAMFLTSIIKLAEPEDVLRLSQADLQSLERAADRRTARHSPPFHVNIVSVRTVTDRGRVRSRIHEVCPPPSPPHCPDPPPGVYHPHDPPQRQTCLRLPPLRRLQDAGRRGPSPLPLHAPAHTHQLRKAHTDAIVPSPPAKDRAAVDAPLAPTTPSSDSLRDSIYTQDGARPPPRLSREKNRLTLRAYLHTLLATPPFSSSPVLRSFLLSGPTRLSPLEQEDARRREEADRVREQGKKEFAREIGARVDSLREAVRTVKGEIVGRGDDSPGSASRKTYPAPVRWP